MKKLLITFLILIASLIVTSAAVAQTEQLSLRLSRDWGYGGFNGDIEGLFSMRATGPSDLVRVDYYIDNTKIGEVNRSPYSLQFNTDNYALGIHKLHAVGYSSGGQEYKSNEISANFVPKQSSTKVLLPVLGIVLAAILLSTLVPLLGRRGKPLHIPLGEQRKYGAGGGGICPKCHRPFPMPLFSAHVGFSKLVRCPFCGKWGLIRTESIEKLRAAEKAELEWEKPEQINAIPEEEKLRKGIDDSKYQGF